MTKWLPNSSPDVLDEIYRRIDGLQEALRDVDRRLHNFDSPKPISRVDPLSYLNPYEGQRAIDPFDEQHMWYSNGEWRKASGPAVYEIKVFEDDEDNIVKNRAFVWEIPEDLDGAMIIRAGAFVTTTGAATTVTITDDTGGSGSILAGNIVVDSGEKSSKTGTTQTSTHVVAWGDQLAINTTTAGGKGLGVWVVVLNANVANAIITGSQGPPGGITAWTGQWVTATPYTTNQAVSNDGVSYVARVDHTSGATSEPGVGANWEDFWQVLTDGSAAVTGITQTVTQTSHGLASGDLVRFNGTDYVLAQANSEANAEVVGIVSSVVDANNFTLQSGGKVTGLSGLSAGTVYYLSESSAGTLSASEPSTAGQVSKPLLIADSSTSGYFFNFRGFVIPAEGDVTISSGSFTPSLTGGGGTDPTMGTGAILTGRFVKIGRLVQVWISIKFGTSGAAAGSGNYRIASLPYNFAANFPVGTSMDAGTTLGTASLKDDSATDTHRLAVVGRWQSEQAMVVIRYDNATSGAFVGSAAPWTWANNDEIHAFLSYETDQ